MVFYDQDLAGPDALHIGKDRDVRVIAWTDEDKTTRKNIAGATIDYVVSTRPGAAAEFTKSTGGSGITLSDPTNGVFTISISASDTSAMDDGFYHHDCTITVDGEEAVGFEGEVELRRVSS